jgi:hypothetical protein
MRDKSSAEGGGGERTNTEILSYAQNDERKVQQQIPYGNDKQKKHDKRRGVSNHCREGAGYNSEVKRE